MNFAIQERHSGEECGDSKIGAKGLECLKQVGLWTTLGKNPIGLEWGSDTLSLQEGHRTDMEWGAGA